MGRSKPKKHRKRKATGSGSNSDEVSGSCKQLKTRGPSGDIDNTDSLECSDSFGTSGASNVTNKCYPDIQTDETCVSSILKETNIVLFDDSSSEIPVFDESSVCEMSANRCVESKKDSETLKVREEKTMASHSESSKSPTNSDIIDYLRRIDSRISGVEKKLEKLDTLEEKVNQFDKEFRKLWIYVEKNEKSTNERLTSMNDRLENVEMSEGQQQSRIDQLEQEASKLRESMSYLQSQSMRNNLIFSNISEENNERPADTEVKVRQFLVDKMKFAQEQVDSFKIERAHRIGHLGNSGRNGQARRIVCKFSLFKDREAIRQKRSELKGTNFYVNEQFPPEVVAKRQRLIPHLKKARSENRTAWIAYDTLYVDGKPWKMD